MIGFAIGGKAGAGKNALGDSLMAILANMGYWPSLFAFGDVLKAEVWAEYRLRKEDPGGREALLTHGALRRSQDVDYFVNQLGRRVYDSLNYGIVPIITDVRYQNEWLWSSRCGLTLVRVEAHVVDRVRALLERGEDPQLAFSDHPSECELDEAEWHYRLRNPHGESIDRLACHLLDAMMVPEAA